MPYSAPAGNAANFQTAGQDFPRPFGGLGFRFPAASYVAPDGGDVQAQFPALPPDWSAPAGDAVAFVVAGEVIITGTGAATVEITAESVGVVQVHAGVGAGVAVVEIEAAGVGGHGVAGTGAAQIEVAATGAAAHGVGGLCAVEIPIAATGAGVVMRYELAGEVRLQGVLVNRLVRAYRRDTGALVGEAMTSAGRFRIHAGFEEREHYLIPIDTANDAADWAPPCANRVVSVLAQDSA